MSSQALIPAPESQPPKRNKGGNPGGPNNPILKVLPHKHVLKAWETLDVLMDNDDPKVAKDAAAVVIRARVDLEKIMRTSENERVRAETGVGSSKSGPVEIHIHSALQDVVIEAGKKAEKLVGDGVIEVEVEE